MDAGKDHIKAGYGDTADHLGLCEDPGKGCHDKDGERPAFAHGDWPQLLQFVMDDPPGVRKTLQHPAVGDMGQPDPGEEEEYGRERDTELHPGEEVDRGGAGKEGLELGEEYTVWGCADDRGDAPDARGVGDGYYQAFCKRLLLSVEVLKLLIRPGDDRQDDRDSDRDHHHGRSGV